MQPRFQRVILMLATLAPLGRLRALRTLRAESSALTLRSR